MILRLRDNQKNNKFHSAANRDPEVVRLDKKMRKLHSAQHKVDLAFNRKIRPIWKQRKRAWEKAFNRLWNEESAKMPK